MKKIPLLAALALLVAPAAFAGYADDRAEIENLSNRYMVAVDAGDIDFQCNAQRAAAFRALRCDGGLADGQAKQGQAGQAGCRLAPARLAGFFCVHCWLLGHCRDGTSSGSCGAKTNSCAAQRQGRFSASEPGPTLLQPHSSSSALAGVPTVTPPSTTIVCPVRKLPAREAM